MLGPLDDQMPAPIIGDEIVPPRHNTLFVVGCATHHKRSWAAGGPEESRAVHSITSRAEPHLGICSATPQVRYSPDHGQGPVIYQGERGVSDLACHSLAALCRDQGRPAAPLAREGSLPGITVEAMTYPLTAAQANLAELVAEARRSHRPVTISEHGKPVAALINVDDLADLEDRAALAAHLADKAAGRGGISLEELDAALDRIDAERIS
jgi:prevent-host-death family protein